MFSYIKSLLLTPNSCLFQRLLKSHHVLHGDMEGKCVDLSSQSLQMVRYFALYLKKWLFSSVQCVLDSILQVPYMIRRHTLFPQEPLHLPPEMTTLSWGSSLGNPFSRQMCPNAFNSQAPAYKFECEINNLTTPAMYSIYNCWSY